MHVFKMFITGTAVCVIFSVKFCWLNVLIFSAIWGSECSYFVLICHIYAKLHNFNTFSDRVQNVYIKYSTVFVKLNLISIKISSMLAAHFHIFFLARYLILGGAAVFVFSVNNCFAEIFYIKIYKKMAEKVWKPRANSIVFN